MRLTVSLSRFAVALAAFSALLASGPVGAGEMVPFKGSLEGEVTRSLPPPPIVVNVVGGGKATHLGKYTVEIPHLVTPPVGVGCYNFVAANGDKLTAEFEGVSVVVAPGILYIVEEATITGGTGRFRNATGSFVTERFYDIAAGTTVGYFEGTISRRGK